MIMSVAITLFIISLKYTKYYIQERDFTEVEHRACTHGTFNAKVYSGCWTAYSHNVHVREMLMSPSQDLF